MALLDPNEIFFNQFEPKQKNRFIAYIDGVPAYLVKGMGAVSLTQGEVQLNHMNIYRKVKGKTIWNDVSFTLYDPITPSGAQAVMEWARSAYESVTGRAGYSDNYKKDVTLNQLGPAGDIVGEWIIKGAFIIDANFGEYDWSSSDVAEISVTMAMDYCILNY